MDAAETGARPAIARLTRASAFLRFIPSGLGDNALARGVLRRTKPLPHVLLRQTLAGGAVFELDVADRAQAHAYLTRRYEPEIVALLVRQIPRSGLLLDVGENIGLITFLVGVRRPDISIRAFEPDADNARRWRRHRKLNPHVNAS